MVRKHLFAFSVFAVAFLGSPAAPKPTVGSTLTGCQSSDHNAARAMRVCGTIGVAPAAGDSTDAMTGLTLHAGLMFQQEVNSFICGKKAQINIYGTPYSATLAEYVTWYTQQLKGYRHVHKIWMQRAQEMFYSPDGTKGVSLTGNAVGPGVFSVSYLQMSVPMTTRQMDAFSPDNPSCK